MSQITTAVLFSATDIFRSDACVIMESLDRDSGIGGIARLSGGRGFGRLTDVDWLSSSSGAIGLVDGTTTRECVRGYGYVLDDLYNLKATGDKTARKGTL